MAKKTAESLVEKIINIQSKSSLPMIIMLGNGDGKDLLAMGGKSKDLAQMMANIMEDKHFQGIMAQATLLQLKSLLK